jgi:hypothetical protein
MSISRSLESYQHRRKREASHRMMRWDNPGEDDPKIFRFSSKETDLMMVNGLNSCYQLTMNRASVNLLVAFISAVYGSCPKPTNPTKVWCESLAWRPKIETKLWLDWLVAKTKVSAVLIITRRVSCDEHHNQMHNQNAN